MTYRIHNSPVQGDLCGVRSPHWAIVRRGYGVDDGGPAGLDHDLLDEGADEGFDLSQLAGFEEVAHLGGEGGDGVGAVEELPPLFQQPSRLLCGDFKGLFALPEFHDEVRSLGHVHAVALRYEVPDAAQLLLHFLKLPVDTLQPLTLLAGHSVHLLVQQLHQVSDVGLGEDVGANLIDDDLLEFLGIEPGGLAGALAALEQGVADVVGVLAALGLGCGHGLAAGLALGDAAEQVGAGGAAGVHLLGGAGAEQPPGLLEVPLGDDGGVCVLDAHGGSSVFGVGSPDHGSGVCFVGEHGVDGGLEPLLAVGGGDALGVEGLGDVEGALSLEGPCRRCAGPRRRRAGSAPAWGASSARPGRGPACSRRGRRWSSRSLWTPPPRIPRVTSWARFSL